MTGSFANWVVMNVSQIFAGQVPPKPPAMPPRPSMYWDCSLVNRATDSEYCGIAPLNQASEAFVPTPSVPVLATTGRFQAAFGHAVAPGMVDVLSKDMA